jgi:hypothetical protein
MAQIAAPAAPDLQALLVYMKMGILVYRAVIGMLPNNDIDPAGPRQVTTRSQVLQISAGVNNDVRAACREWLTE